MRNDRERLFREIRVTFFCVNCIKTPKNFSISVNGMECSDLEWVTSSLEGRGGLKSSEKFLLNLLLCPQFSLLMHNFTSKCRKFCAGRRNLAMEANRLTVLARNLQATEMATNTLFQTKDQLIGKGLSSWGQKPCSQLGKSWFLGQWFRVRFNTHPHLVLITIT